MFFQNFVKHNKKTTDRNEFKNFFSGIENNTPGFFKISGIKTEVILR